MTVKTAISTPETDEAVFAHRAEFKARLELVHTGASDVLIRYEIAGPKDAPLLIIAGGISAGRHTLRNAKDPAQGWWQCQSAALEDHAILSIDWLGADGELDQPIEASDQAEALLATLDALGIEKAAAFIGASYGAMVGMHCASLAPKRIGELLGISAAHRSHPFTSAQRALQRQIIELCEGLGCARSGVALARKLAILTYRTPDEFAERFSSPTTIVDGRARASSEPYLDHMGVGHSSKMHAAAYRRLSESIDLHRIEPSKVKVRSTFVAVDSDQLVPLADVEELASEVSGARLIRISSRFGHDAFLKEERAIGAIIRNFLDSLEQQS